MRDENHTRIKWDLAYGEQDGESGLEQWPAARVLTENVHLLPVQGRALDVACGMGANAMLLASRGLQTDAWDISQVAIDGLAAMAQKQNLPLQASVRNIERQPPPADQYDVIVVAHYLYRHGCAALIQALRPGGLLFYQTFTNRKVCEEGPKSEDFLLKENELLRLFAPLEVVVYREEGLLGDTEKGFRNKAMFVGCKKNS